MEIFEVNMQCVISNNSEIINVTTPLLFRFQYIDQDDGWSDIGNEFKNVRYIKDWKGDTNKFITGYLNNDYYKLKAKKIQLSNDKEEKLKELKSNEMFVNSISHDLKKKSQLENLNQLNTVDDVQKKLIKLRNDTDDLRKKEYSIKEKMIKLDNNIFMKKIELNNKINDNLLEIINTLYKNEFIDVKEYKRAEEIADITIGKTPPRGNKECFSTKNEDVKWASIADLGKCGTYILDTREKLTKEAVDNYNVKVIPKNTIILSFKLTIGRIAITSQEMATNEAIAHFNLEDKDMLYYLYSYLKNFDYEKLGSTSSIATAVNSKIIKAMPIVIPDKETLENYNEKVSSMFEKIRENEFENKKLEQLRDTLLPELMNGEIDLDNIKI